MEKAKKIMTNLQEKKIPGMQERFWESGREIFAKKEMNVPLMTIIKNSTLKQ